MRSKNSKLPRPAGRKGRRSGRQNHQLDINPPAIAGLDGTSSPAPGETPPYVDPSHAKDQMESTAPSKIERTGKKLMRALTKKGQEARLPKVACLVGAADPIPATLASNMILTDQVADGIEKLVLRAAAANPGCKVQVVTIHSAELDELIENGAVQMSLLHAKASKFLAKAAPHSVFVEIPHVVGVDAEGRSVLRPKVVSWVVSSRDDHTLERETLKSQHLFQPVGGSAASIEITNVQMGDGNGVILRDSIDSVFTYPQRWKVARPDGTKEPSAVTTSWTNVTLRSIELLASLRLEAMIFGRGRLKSGIADLKRDLKTAAVKGKEELTPPLGQKGILHMFYDMYKSMNVDYRPALVA